MKLAGDWLSHPGTQALCALLEGAGFRALFVGGCVRNALLGTAVSDLDLATDALPETVADLAGKAGFKVVPTGIAHGTLTVLAKGAVHEVTTFRRDVQTDGRHAIVAFSSDIAEDAARRDFTMNALYADPRGQVIDPLGCGLADLQARKLRFVGDAQQRIREDFLRILRFFRFHAWYGDPDAGLDAEGLAACAGHLDGLAHLSAERVSAELRKLLAAPDPAPALSSMALCGALAAVLPGADPRAIAPLVHLEQGVPAPWLGRLAALGGEDPADRLRLSRAESRDLAALRAALGRLDSPAVLGWRLGADLGRAALLVRAALLESPLPETWPADLARGAAAVFPLRAADLPHLQGPALGAELKRLQQRWLAADLHLSRDRLLD